jgi:hypothetical protein
VTSAARNAGQATAPFWIAAPHPAAWVRRRGR